MVEHGLITLIGSLRNIPRVQEIAASLEAAGYNVNDSWSWHGPDPDKFYHLNCLRNKMTYREAMAHPLAKSVFNVDKSFIDKSETIGLILPAGRSAFLEAGYALSQGKKVFVIEYPTMTWPDSLKSYIDKNAPIHPLSAKFSLVFLTLPQAEEQLPFPSLV